MKDIKTDNELIAEFMGQPLTLTRDTGYGITEHKIDYQVYQTSWDALMPVVEKITPIAKQVGQIAWFDVRSHLLDAKIDVVHKAVVEFIKFYNSQNK